ncbi:MAG: Cys-tRNA(Pro) deacylase YbaK [Oscillospiraceae bacterium]|nr:Cys-tRNA(Pro) deacylase YbaK [Oscillospiraceae bacterium]
MTEEKTNVMRILTQKKIPFTPHFYPHGEEAVDGVSVAALLNQDPASVFKTLVCQGASRTHYVFIIPVAEELDFKAAARAVGEKSVVLIPVKDLLPLTGYVRGGCSPIGMKKRLVTVLDETALSRDTIIVSGGKIGTQVELAPLTLAKLVDAHFAPLAKEALS